MMRGFVRSLQALTAAFTLTGGMTAVLAADTAPAAKPAAGAAKAAAVLPQVDLQTSMGTVTIELWPDKAPKTVANFLQYVKEGFYDGTVIHRVEPGFVIQGGGYTADGTRKSTHAPIPLEDGEHNDKYTISMARTGDPNSATSQFFISLRNNRGSLDRRGDTPGYAVFGKVVKGTDVVEKLGNVVVKRGSDGMQHPTTTITLTAAKLVGGGQ